MKGSLSYGAVCSLDLLLVTYIVAPSRSLFAMYSDIRQYGDPRPISSQMALDPLLLLVLSSEKQDWQVMCSGENLWRMSSAEATIYRKDDDIQKFAREGKFEFYSTCSVTW